MIKINDRSRNRIYSSNMELIDNFTDYSSKNLDFDKPVEVEFLDDEENAKNPLGATAHYNPDEMKITIYVTGRHLKDILRSISHELIHHVQNCRGDLDHGINKLGYAQDDKHMRGMEHEAYTMGNIMIFRDFEDNYKRGKKMPAKNKLSKLKEMIKKGVEEVINEQSSEIGVGAGVKRIGGSGRGFDLGRDWNPKREQLKGGNVQQLSQFILDKQNDAFISNDEMTVMYLGTLKVIQKGKICALTKLLEKGTYTSKAGYNRGRQGTD